MVVRPADEFAERVVLVSGAGNGIGRAVALLAAQRGARVAVLDADAEAAERVAGEARARGAAAALAIACDVRAESQVVDAFAATAGSLGVPTGVVTSAGIDRAGLAHELPGDAWDHVIEVNLRGTFLVCREALRGMLGAGRPGGIVCVSSPFAFVSPLGGAGAYSASKAGVSALVRSLAVDYASHGVRVNAILPGPTETGLMWNNVQPEEVDGMRATIRAEVPLGRLADPDEPARAALWLLSDDASYVTGSQIPCDGGVLAKASISV
jgi:NAD(P)-dependent dehydrogenase (short-subunit alcohol dehydrogenase family)